MGSSGIEWLQLILHLVGGLALFLLGMETLTGALRSFASGKLKGFLQAATRNRGFAVVSGALVTAAVQSSSITTVLLVGFGSAGLLSLANSAGMILGANIGSTVTAQIIAFDVTRWSFALVACGFLMRFWRRPEHIRYAGEMLLGLGLIFLGMDFMSDATRPLREFPPFVDLMASLDNAFWGILCGLLFTAVVQSSAATAGLTIVLASEGFLNLEGAVAVIMGANVGTCVTALMATVGQPREALRVALIHIAFNVAGVLVWLPFVPVLCDLSAWVTDWVAGNASTHGGGNDIGRMVANAHTVFNLINAGLFFGFIPIIVRAVEKLVPESEPSAPSLNPLLDDYYLKEPEAALGQVQGEIVNFMQSVSAIHQDLSRAILDRNDKTIRDLGGIDDQIDARQEHFLRFLGRLGEKRLTSRQQKSLNSYVGVVNLVENLGDLIDHRFQQLGQDLIDLKSVMSKETAQAFAELTKLVEAAFAATIDKMAADSTGSAGRVFEAERKVRKFARESKSALSMRLANRSEERLRIFRIEIDLIECQAQMAYLSAEMAREIES